MAYISSYVAGGVGRKERMKRLILSMGTRHSRPFVGRGSTLTGACDDLSQQLQRHFGTT